MHDPLCFITLDNSSVCGSVDHLLPASGLKQLSSPRHVKGLIVFGARERVQAEKGVAHPDLLSVR